MAANIDTMIYIGETPWHGLGIDLTDDPPKTSAEIICKAELGWGVNSAPIKTDLHDHIPSWNAIYREDNNQVLGVIHKSNPILVQNTDMFSSVEYLMGSDMDIETAASLGKGETVFGCFKIREQYKLLDDDVDHYFVIVNDHLRADGKITILNTPVRVVCQNTLSEALDGAVYKLRVPVSTSAAINSSLSANILNNVGDSILGLKKKAESLVSKKIDSGYVNRFLDTMFPFQLIDGVPAPTTANQNIQIMRTTFINECMGADNLENYRGTQYQVFNALTDWCQHYHKSAEKAYDINYRMTLVPGVKAAIEGSKVSKFLKIADQLAA